jgi:TRAP transporter 4TM/12TM fusion protein
MKSIGYSGEFAGAVEAVASTGGQLMPPIMGAAAFIMADILGVPYTNVVKAAIIPVFLYYFGTYIQIHLRAKRLGLRGLIEEEIPDVRKTLRERGHLLIPMVVLVALLVMRYTPLYAAFYALILCVMVTFLKRETRMSLKDIIWALETGAKRTVTVSIACASVGIVIGISTLTGIGTTLGNAILSLAGGNLYICLFLVMILAIILGMGMPTVAAYIILATVAVPAICEFDVPRLAAHFFVFYFGLMANVTPPVAIPAYAAAGIAESDPSKTGLTAFRLALAGFIVPYLFMTYPQMLMIGSVSLEMVLATVSATLGVAGLGCAVEGFLVSPLRQWQRAVLTLGSLLMIIPGIVTDLAGISLVAAMWLMQVKLKSGQHAEAQ